MVQNSVEIEIQERVSAFVEELTELFRRSAMEAVGDALGGVAAPARERKATVRKSPAKKGARLRRSSEDLEEKAAAVLDYVKAHSGQRLEEISAGMATNSKELKRPIQMLLANRKLKKTGAKRGTQYFAGAVKAAKKAGQKTTKKKATKKAAKKTRRKAGKKTAKVTAG